MDEIVVWLPVRNGGGALLEVVLEPYGRDYWLRPGESLLIHTVSPGGGEAGWPGTAKGNDPFEIDYRLDSIQVHFNGSGGWVTDLAGNELDCGHQRP